MSIFSKIPFFKSLSLFYRYPGILTFKKNLENLNRDYVLLVGTPLKQNLGDHLTTSAEISFLKRCYPGKKIFEIPAEIFVRYEEEIQWNINSTVDVFVTGGGWMGNAWPEEEKILQKIIRTFARNRMVILPQTVFYDRSNKQGQKLFASMYDTLAKCRDVLLCARDVSSYDFAVANFPIPRERVVLSPDIGLFYIDETPNIHAGPYVGVHLKKDRKEPIPVSLIREIMETLDAEGMDLFQSDTDYPGNVPIWQREKRIHNKLLDMKGCMVILTDRLNAMVYASVAKRKCIALDDETGTVRGTYDKWLKWSKNILFINEDKDEDVAENVRAFLKEPIDETENAEALKEDFEKLQDLLSR